MLYWAMVFMVIALVAAVLPGAIIPVAIIANAITVSITVMVLLRPATMIPVLCSVVIAVLGRGDQAGASD